MKRLIGLVGVLLVATTAYAEWYKVTVTRKAANVYRDRDSGIFIITKWCYEYAYDEEAVLRYDRYDKYSNRLVFDSGTECPVEEVR